MLPSDRAAVILATTPGVVCDSVFQRFGIGEMARRRAARKLGGRLERTEGFGYRLIRA